MSNENKSTNPNVLSRRSVVKVALATAPIIATLPTGAALARSSNLISASAPSGALDGSGKTLCLSASSGTMSGTSMDLGNWPHGYVTTITPRDYRVDNKGSAATVTEGSMCNQGGTFYYQQAGWQQVNVPRGMLVSATALSSFAGSIRYTNV